jgi:MFS family permease
MNMSMLGLMYGYAPERNRTVYMGTLYAVNGVAGFAGALLGATALGILGMHGTFALSAVLLVFAAALSAFLFRRRTEADSRTVLE